MYHPYICSFVLVDISRARLVVSRAYRNHSSVIVRVTVMTTVTRRRIGPVVLSDVARQQVKYIGLCYQRVYTSVELNLNS